jgi:putative SOS response-associated peptidase YedK
VTTEANGLVRPVHDRMPAILAPEDYATWLDPDLSRVDALSGLLRPFQSARMAARRVDPAVDDPRDDDPLSVAPLA